MKLVLIPRTQLSARLSQRSTLRAKSLTWLPSNVLGSSPIIVTANGLSYTVSLDLPTLIASLNIYYQPQSQSLTDLAAAANQIISDHTRIAALEGEASALHREYRRGEVRSSILTADAMAMAAHALERVRRKAASDQIALTAQVFN